MLWIPAISSIYGRLLSIMYEPSGNSINIPSPAFAARVGLFLSVSVPQRHFMPSHSRHFSF